MAQQQRYADLATVGSSLSRTKGSRQLSKKPQKMVAEALNAIWHLHAKNPDHRDFELVRALLGSKLGFP
jgi:hypothetical protein